MLDVGVLPCLWQASVVPKNGTVIISELALLDILSDGVGLFLGRYFHLSLGVLRDLVDEVEKISGGLQWDVVPWGDGLAVVGEEYTEISRAGLPLRAARDGRKSRCESSIPYREGKNTLDRQRLVPVSMLCYYLLS